MRASPQPVAEAEAHRNRASGPPISGSAAWFGSNRNSPCSWALRTAQQPHLQERPDMGKPSCRKLTPVRSSNQGGISICVPNPTFFDRCPTQLPSPYQCGWNTNVWAAGCCQDPAHCYYVTSCVNYVNGPQCIGNCATNPYITEMVCFGCLSFPRLGYLVCGLRADPSGITPIQHGRWHLLWSMFDCEGIRLRHRVPFLALRVRCQQRRNIYSICGFFRVRDDAGSAGCKCTG